LRSVSVALLALAACSDPAYDGRFPQPDDVRLEVPPASGEAQSLITATAGSVDTWIGDVLLAIEPIVQPLADHRETSRDGGARFYGPFDDPDGRDLAWYVVFLLEGGTTLFRVYVGSSGATDSSDVFPVVSGHLEIDGELRKGAFELSMSTLDEYRAISDDLSASQYGGNVVVAFERDPTTEHRLVDLSFTEFRVDGWFSEETYAYRREADGAGVFHLAATGDLGGRRVDRVELDTRWRADRSGRTRATARPDGELVLDECFDAAGVLSYRELTDADAMQVPGYAFGDERTCAFAAHEL
jgi:hypothetical protein